MNVKNVSARGHHVGGVFIAPGETKEIPEEYVGSIDSNDLEEAEEDSKSDAESFNEKQKSKAKAKSGK